MDTLQIIAITGGALGIMAVLVKVISWLFGVAVREATYSMLTRLLIIEQQHHLLWGVAEQRAMETLHHHAQPEFDFLIEQFRAHTMTAQQLTQFIERLEAIIASEGQMAEQVPSARLLLNSALTEQATRGNLPDSTVATIQAKENMEAGERMKVEAESNILKGEH